MNLLKRSQGLSASPTVQDELETIRNSTAENEIDLNRNFLKLLLTFRIQLLIYTKIHEENVQLPSL